MTDLTSPIITATACERFDCGHITRSSSVPVKRALFLYMAESADLGYLGSREDAHTLAALALMREGARCADVLRAGGVEGDAVAAVLDPAMGLPTPRQCEALAMVAEGLPYPEIAARLSISVETVRSLLKAAMRTTLTHSATAAAVVAASEGLI
jgi:DNA-binding NarL/FixJ family response regulator